MSQRIGYVQQNAGCTSSTITTQHTYDSSGNPITAIDGDGHLGCTLSSGSTQYSGCAFYDGSDTHLTRALNAKNQAITYRYDTTTASAGYGQWLMSSTDANGQTTVYSYDTLGRLTSVVKPGDTQAYPTTSYTYINTCTVGATNPCLELDTTTRVTSGSNTTTTTRQWYDGMGRLVETQAPGPNQFSKLPAVGSVLLTYTYYDDMGRESTQSLPYAIAASATVNYASPNWNQARTQTSYDSLGRPVGSVTYPDGEIVTSTYDNNDYFRSMSTANGALVSAVQYTNAGQLAGMTVGGVAYQGTVTTPVQVSLGYDSIQRPISTSVSVNGNALFSQQQTYDNVGNVIQLSTTLPSSSGGSLTDNQAFCYDALNRLVWAGNSGTPPGDDSCGASPGGSTTASYSQSFSYDALDRMTSGPAGTETYGNTSHVHAATTLSSLPNAYASYDAMGNMTCRNVSTSSSQSCGSGTQTGATMTYDNEGRLSTWTAPKGSTGSEQYLYDNEGNRVLQQQSTSTGTTSVITFDGYTDTTISNGSKSTTKYYHADGQTVAEVTGTAWYVLVPDLLGSAVLALRSDGSVQAMQLYTPYGSSRYSMGTMPTAYNFTGQRFDSQTGLLYYNARYYDPMSGRFTSGDTVLNNSSGMDPYAYVGDNPTSATDPTGHLLIEGGEGGGGGEAGDAGGDGDGDAGVGGGGGDSGGLVDVTTATGGTEVLEPGAVPDLSGSQGNVTAEYNPNDGTVMTVTNNADGSTTTTSLNPGDPGYEDAMNIASGMASFPDETSDAEANPESWGIEGGSTEAPPSEPASPPSKAAVAPSTGGSEPAAAPEATGSSEPAAAPEATGSSEPATESNGKCSFTAQTKVATQNGSQAIGTLKVGEKVRAYNPKTKKVQEEPILHVWIHQDNDLVDLTITHVTHTRGVKPSSEVIHTNKKHPFLTVEKGFLPVGQIKLEMHVVEADGQLGVITGWKLVPGVKTMYNLEVAQDHTFVVGVGMWVVHNCTDPEAGSWLRESSLNNAPRQTTPGTSVISGEHVNDLGQIEPYEAHYDEYGRQIGRTDYTGGNATEGIPPIHYHATIYTPDFPAGLDLPPALDHGPGEYSPGSRGLFYLL